MANSINRPWEILDDSRRLRRIMRVCREKAYEIEQLLFSNCVEVFREKLHLQPGPERKYWSAGYLQALRDMTDLMNTGTFPCQI